MKHGVTVWVQCLKRGVTVWVQCLKCGKRWKTRLPIAANYQAPQCKECGIAASLERVQPK